MSDRDVLEMLDRAAAEAPSMFVAPSAVVEGGRRKVRRRRTAAAGTALGTLALAAAVWAGPGGALLGSPGLTPAGEGTATSATRVEATVGSTLVMPDGTRLKLSAQGQVLVVAGGDEEYRIPIEAASGTVVHLFDTTPVLLAPGWDLKDAGAARVAGQTPIPTEWVTPSSVARVDVGDIPLVVTTLPDTPPEGEIFAGEAQADGSVDVVQLGSPLAALDGLRVEGVTLTDPTVANGGSMDVDPTLTAKDVTVTRDGVRLEPLDDQPEVGWSFRDADGRVLVLVPQAGVEDDAVLVPFGRHESRALESLAPETVTHGSMLVDADGTLLDVFVASVETPGEVEGLVAYRPSLANEGISNVWSFVGLDASMTAALDGGLALVNREHDLWALAPSVAPGERPAIEVARLDDEAMFYPLGGNDFLVTVGTSGPAGHLELVLSAGATSPSGGTASEGVEEYGDLAFYRVTTPGEGALPDYVYGVDNNGDGEADIPLRIWPELPQGQLADEAAPTS